MITQDELLDRLKHDRAAWDELIQRVPGGRFEEPGACGAWSVKDVIAHIAWHEKEMVGLLDTRELTGSPWWLLPTDERNANICEESRQRPLEDVLAEADAIYAQLVDALSTLEDDALNDPAWFLNMPPDWIPGDILSQNTLEHYNAHRQSVSKWLTSQENRHGGEDSPSNSDA